MQRFRELFFGLGVAVVLSIGVVSLPVFADNCSSTPSSPLCQAKVGVDKAGGSTGSNGTSLTVRIHEIINLIIYAVGFASVIMIVIGGVRYTTSGGDSSGTKGAKDTILYAIVGLVVAVMAYAIVNFVLRWFA
ncbi:MAG TPA: pilin [Candidatus Saccharimonadaceae bacterium]|nr:pilin [Candidatus Saccharimonadaceae bacterium]